MNATLHEPTPDAPPGTPPPTDAFPPEPPPQPPPPAGPPPPEGPPPGWSPPPEGAPPPGGPWLPRLARDPDDRVIAGVCAALGRHTGTDPVLWRVVVAVLTLFGGVGLVLYAIGWLLIPQVHQQASWLESRLRRSDGAVTPLAVVLGVGALLILLALLDSGSGAVALVVVAVLGYLVYRNRRDAPAAGRRGDHSPGPGPSVAAPGGYPSGPTYPPPSTSFVTGPSRPERRPRSPLVPVTLSLAALVAGLLVLLDRLGVGGITAPRVLAAALLVVGGGLVAGAFFGRSRWLIPVGLVLALLLAPVAVLDGRFAGGVGERTWVPGAADSRTAFRLGAGDATLDLRRVGASAASLRAEVGAGRLLVLVPADLPVTIRPDLRAGELHVLDQGTLSVVDVSPFDDEQPAARRLGPDRAPPGADASPPLELQLVVGVGQIEVRRALS